MPELPNSFLADIDGLSHIIEEDNVDAVKMEEDIDGDDLDNVSKLQKTQHYKNTMWKVEEALQKGSYEVHGMLLVQDDHQLILDCNKLSLDIENEIIIIHNFIRDKYRLKFPELESLVQHPIDYARVVKKIGNETDLVRVDLKGLVPSAIIIAISVSASTTSGKSLPDKVLENTVEACDRLLDLETAKKKVLDFIESRLVCIAPNLSAIVGSSVAAKLIGAVGGLSELKKMASCDVKCLGAKRKNLAGFSSATSRFYREVYLEQTEIFQSTPPASRKQACNFLASKSVLAARLDYEGGYPMGNKGREYREEIIKKIEKLQEPTPPKIPKLHPVTPTDFKLKNSKRGGRRRRKMKERYAQTPMTKLANRIQLGVPEVSSLGDGFGEGYGMLGQAAGSGKLRPASAPTKLSARVPIKFKKRYGSSGAASGVTSSFAFTQVQGLELSNPQAHAHQLCSSTQTKYFSQFGSFSKIKS